MKLFGFLEAPSSYVAGKRLKGFPRYHELLDRFFPVFFRVNLLTILGFIPLFVGFQAAVESADPVLMLVVCALGGAVAGPFFACLVDSIYRALRDAPGGWFENYRRAWRQNWRVSIFPGMIFSSLLGGYGLAVIFLYSGRVGGWGTIALIALSLLFFTMFFSIYWPLLTLIDQPNAMRIRNCLAFLMKSFWKLAGISVLQIGYWLLMILFFPLTLLAVPFLGFWFILFLANFLVYDSVNETFEIEAQIAEHYPEQAAIYDLE